jgi:hypothetical protein
MRAQKMREEADEKEIDEHFNNIRSVIPMRQEWRVKENADTPTPMTSDDDMDLLDDDEASLMKDGVFATDQHGCQHGVHAADRV